MTAISAGFLGLSIRTRDGISELNEITHLLELDVSKKEPKWKFVKRPRVGKPAKYPRVFYDDMALISGVLYLMVEALGNEYAKQELSPNSIVTERIYGSMDNIWRGIRNELEKYPFIQVVIMAFDGSILNEQSDELKRFKIRHRLVFETDPSTVGPLKASAS